MVTRTKKQNAGGKRQRNLKVDELKLNKETVKDLSRANKSRSKVAPEPL